MMRLDCLTELHLKQFPLTGDVTGDITSSGASEFTNRLQLKSTDGTPARLDFYCESMNFKKKFVELVVIELVIFLVV